MAKRTRARSRGQMIAKGKDKWLLRVYLGREPVTNKRLYDSCMFSGTQTEAQAELGIMQARRDTNTHVKPNDHTVSTYWPLHLQAKRKLSDNTREQYQGRYTMDIAPFLGDYKLSDVDALLVEQWITWMQATRQVSPRTIRYSYTLLHGMFESAVAKNLVGRNPVKAELPAKVHNEQAVLSPAEAVAVLDSSRDAQDPLYALWSLLLHAGLRPQEALALTWADFDGRKVYVRRALKRVRGEDGKLTWVVGPTKTAKSVGSVSVDGECAAALKAHQVATGGIGSAYVFQTANGTFLDMANVRKAWQRACKRAQVPAVRLYDTRHTHATMLLLAGVHLKVVSERLRHSSVATTGDIYSHVTPEMDEGAADTMGAVLRKARKA